MDAVLTTVKQINEKQKGCIYIIYANEALAASSQKYEMDRFLESADSIIGVADDDLDDVVVIYGLVLNPMELPFEVSDEVMKGRHVWLIREEGRFYMTMESYDTIKDAAEAIEEAFDDGCEASIDDFAVVIAEELELCLNIAKVGSSLLASKVYE